MTKSKNPKDKLKSLLGPDFYDSIEKLSDNQTRYLYTMTQRPDLSIHINKQTSPRKLSFYTSYGSVRLDHSLTSIDTVFVNNGEFDAIDKKLTGLVQLLGTHAEENITPKPITQSTSRSRRNRTGAARKVINDLEFNDALKEKAFRDLSKSNLTYDSLFIELQSIIPNNQANITLHDLMTELSGNKVEESDIARFLIYDSSYNKELVSALYGFTTTENKSNYTFEDIQQDDSFIGRILKKLDVESALYDKKEGVLKIGDRYITNLPYVDEKGVFHNKYTSYIPYHIGYFAEKDGTRVERLRHIDPVENAIHALSIHYKLTSGDVKFKTILDVTRNLPDFDNHPYGAEILDTLKRKLVLDKNYLKTNSLLAEHQRTADELGAVALTMLDDDARGLIDPYGTSNGSNMGVIFYLTQDAQFHPNGTFIKGTKEHSLVGDVMNQFHVDKDNFNRNQMSFNAMLTSTDVKKLKVAYSEFALWNSEDAVVLTKKGSQQFQELMTTGDKVTDMHGNKSVSSLIIDPDMDMTQAKDEQLQYAVEMAKLNPELDLIVSPVSLASRLNMGVAHEGVLSEYKSDLVKPNGEIVKDGIVEIAYMSLPQTAEHKSKDYSIEGQGRKYSTLFRTALASKIGDELYTKALISEETRQNNIHNIHTSLGRLGVSFENKDDLFKEGNLLFHTDAPVTIDSYDLKFKTTHAIRDTLHHLIDSKGVDAINIKLHDMQLLSPYSNTIIKDNEGNTVLPIRVHDGGIPYRFTDTFKALSTRNQEALQSSYSTAVSQDMNALIRKDNLLKHINTMIFKEGARTEMIVPDPRLPLGSVRSAIDCDRIIAHRDPCIQSGNVISFHNVGGNEPNIMHVNPLMINQVNGDFDSDTMGENSYDNLTISDEEKAILFEKSCVREQLNRYGEVYLSTDGSHFRACLLANQIDGSSITFDDGKSNEELEHIVEDKTKQILNSPNSYGAYALSFTDDQVLKTSLAKLAEDGIKGNKEDMLHHYDHGYTDEENRAVMKALIAKSEWTGLAGAITNSFIAELGDDNFHPTLVRQGLDITFTMTQSVLQMKKNADKLIPIDNSIRQMKQIMGGKYSVDESEELLLQITDGLTPEKCVKDFVQTVRELGNRQDKFGYGLFNNTDMSTSRIAFTSEAVMLKTVQKLKTKNKEISFDELTASLNQLSPDPNQISR